jgi:hypothetical protein
MYIMETEPTSTACFINPSHQSLCLYVYPVIIARHLLGKCLSPLLLGKNVPVAMRNYWEASFSMLSVSYQRKVDH